MAGNIHRGNENEPIALEFYFWLVVIGYYESPISTTTNSVTNLCWKTSFYDADYLKNDVFILEKETFFNIILTCVNQMKFAISFLNLKKD